MILWAAAAAAGAASVALSVAAVLCSAAGVRSHRSNSLFEHLYRPLSVLARTGSSTRRMATSTK